MRTSVPVGVYIVNEASSGERSPTQTKTHYDYTIGVNSWAHVPQPVRVLYHLLFAHDFFPEVISDTSNGVLKISLDGMVSWHSTLIDHDSTVGAYKRAIQISKVEYYNEISMSVIVWEKYNDIIKRTCIMKRKRIFYFIFCYKTNAVQHTTIWKRFFIKSFLILRGKKNIKFRESPLKIWCECSNVTTKTN